MSVEQHDWTAWPRRNTAIAPNGYIYVIEFGYAVVKVGRTDSPWSRGREHERAAAKFGSGINRAWLSPPHGEWVANEGRLIAAAHRLSSLTGGREYFRCAYEDIVPVAAGLDMTYAEPEPPKRPVVSPEFRERVIEIRYAFAGRSWEDKGYASWQEYCAVELADLHARKLRRDERRYLARALYMTLSEFEADEGLTRPAAEMDAQ